MPNNQNTDQTQDQENPNDGNNTGTGAVLNLTNAFTNANDITKKIAVTYSELNVIGSKIKDLKEERKTLREKIKPVKREIKKSVVAGLEEALLTKEERKIIRAKLKFIKKELRLLEEQRSNKYEEYSSLCAAACEDFDKQDLSNRANAKEYLKRNGWSIRSRIVGTLNKAIKNDLPALKTLSALAKSRVKADAEKFNLQLSDLLDATDPDTYVLCSGLLRTELYGMIRQTLKAWNSRKADKFDELIY